MRSASQWHLSDASRDALSLERCVGDVLGMLTSMLPAGKYDKTFNLVL